MQRKNRHVGGVGDAANQLPPHKRLTRSHSRLDTHSLPAPTPTLALEQHKYQDIELPSYATWVAT